MAAWEPFRNNVDMDKEEHMLKSLVKERPKKDESNVTGSMAAMKAWHTVDRRARDALRRNSHLPLVEAFEERILVYVKSAEAGEVLTLEVQDPFHRLVLHGICEFYGLVSNTVSKWEDTAGGFSLVTRTHIRKKKHPKSSDSVQPVRLVDFLSAMKNGVPNSEAAA
uniref:R3H-associated N-terminal domain-containing protein n=1 Tax=Picea sitchensis TaxID=3332 RepID=C0PTT7_PICSI|nr:unknown [Picea sitchensis]